MRNEHVAKRLLVHVFGKRTEHQAAVDACVFVDVFDIPRYQFRVNVFGIVEHLHCNIERFGPLDSHALVAKIVRVRANAHDRELRNDALLAQQFYARLKISLHGFNHGFRTENMRDHRSSSFTTVSEARSARIVYALSRLRISS